MLVTIGNVLGYDKYEVLKLRLNFLDWQGAQMWKYFPCCEKSSNI